MTCWEDSQLFDVPDGVPPVPEPGPVELDPVEEARQAVTFTANDGAALLRSDALRLPLRDESVDLVVTSPPYFALRSYQDGDEHYDGQIGSEATPQAFLEALWAVTGECLRVLKPGGSIFLNLGDKMSGSGGHNNASIGGTGRGPASYNKANAGIPAKSLMLLPEAYRLGCNGLLHALGGPPPPSYVDRHGQLHEGPWIARAVIIWSKCLSGGTVVYAKAKGRPLVTKVHDLCRAYRPEDVQLWNGEKWTQVTWWEPTGRHHDSAESYKSIRAARRRGDDPAVGGDIEIELRSGERIGCTREHRWPTQRGLVDAADLQVGDIIETTRLPEGGASPAALDDEMVGWFVGLYIAEGSRSGTTIQIAGHVNEVERYKRLRELAAAFHANCAVHHTGGNTATINLTGRFLDAILGSYVGGRTAKDKHLAPKAWTRSNRFLRAVLDGYLSGDGSYDAKLDRWQLGFTNNDALASDLRVLAARLGVSVRLRRTTHTGFGREWPGWGGNLYMDPSRRRQPDSQVVAIRQSRARQFWDIGVEDEPHLFALGSGVLTHNSNGLPESVTDRVRRSHEDWVHLVKRPRYYAAVDEIREPSVTGDRVMFQSTRGQSRGLPPRGPSDLASVVRANNPLGKLPGSVWEVATEPLRVPEWVGVDHFAAFPQELPRRFILGWAPSGVCRDCGFLLGSSYDYGVLGVRKADRKGAPQGQVGNRKALQGGEGEVLQQNVLEPVERTEQGEHEVPTSDDAGLRGGLDAGPPDGSEERLPDGASSGDGGAPGTSPRAGRGGTPQERGQDGQPDRESRAAVEGSSRPAAEASTEAVPVPALRRSRPDVRQLEPCPHCGSCSIRPSMIVDPFGGTGTTALVARSLGRFGVSVDLSADYLRLARWRIWQSGHGSKAVSRTWRDRQGSLFEEGAA